MPLNPKQERFAQALADGNSASRAYEMAGYKPHRSNASALARSQHVSARVHGLLQARVDVTATAIAKASETLALDKQWVLSRLMQIVERCMEAVPVLVFGQPTGQWVFDAKGANKALELLGKHLGLWVAGEEKPDLGALLALIGNGRGNGNGHERPRVYDA